MSLDYIRRDVLRLYKIIRVWIILDEASLDLLEEIIIDKIRWGSSSFAPMDVDRPCFLYRALKKSVAYSLAD